MRSSLASRIKRSGKPMANTKQEVRSRFRLMENVEYVHRGADGKIKGRYTISNLVTNAGMAGVASRINGAGSEAAFTYIALGVGTTAAAATDTALESEVVTVGGERAAATCTRVTTDVTNDTAQLVYTFTFTGSLAITESGVLNAAAAGVLLSRQVFSAINVISGDSLQITWKFDVD